MSETRGAVARGLSITRRTAMLASLAALSGCGLWDNWFGTKKTPLPGKRETLASGQGQLTADKDAGKVTLPPPVRNAAWPQDGGNPSHLMGHLAAGDRLTEAWSSGIGDGGGYRKKILAHPVSANGVVYTMDSAGLVRAFDLTNGGRLWEFDTTEEKDRSTNIGGGLAFDNGTLYAVNGIEELVALDAAKGTVRWRSSTGTPARSASSQRASAEKGVAVAGFSTIVHPAASAGPHFLVIIAAGKFHGVIAAHTPIGSLMTTMRLSAPCEGIVSP
jgi:hypothetical protein